MRRLLVFCAFIGFLLFSRPANGQILNDFGFRQWTDLPVEAYGKTLLNAWAGGLNNAQFGKYDLDSDGKEDLLVFDRHGDRLLTFLYREHEDTGQSYVYEPYYRKFFPKLNHWFQTADYNGDGKPDIFTYTPGGIMVYKNTGTTFPEFEKAVDPYILSLQGPMFTNLLVTYVDYPAIVDIDGDGDLDILTFWGLGTWVDLHLNRSMEETGTADSLLFHKVSSCWGNFGENPESNIIYLDTCFNKGSRNAQADDPKHTGSTFCLIDITGNGVYDLLLGDVDYPDMANLVNGGTNIDAFMVEQLEAYPEDNPVKLWSFPLVQHIDLANSGKKDLVASPFDPSLVRTQGIESVWRYEDVSAGGKPEFVLKETGFLQNTMIDAGLGAYPVFADVNNDGLTDMVVGNFGLFDTCVYNASGQLKCVFISRLALYLNKGTATSPRFELEDDDFGKVSDLLLQGACPAFADLDGDGDVDMLLGYEEGKILFFRNMAGPGVVPVFAAPVMDYGQIQVDGFSTPVLMDIDGDGLPDLVSGSRNGRLSYYHNEGSATQPDFRLISDFWGGVNVTDPLVSYTGYSVPAFIRQADGTLNLLVGSESGLISRYKGITAGAGALFSKADDHFMYINEGIRTAPAVADLNADGFPDLAVGNYCGGVSLFRGITPDPAGVPENQGDRGLKAMVSPNPAAGDAYLTIMAEGIWQVSIYNMQAKPVKNFLTGGFHAAQINTEDLPAGIYFIVCTHTGNPQLQARVRLAVIR